MMFQSIDTNRNGFVILRHSLDLPQRVPCLHGHSCEWEHRRKITSEFPNSGRAETGQNIPELVRENSVRIGWVLGEYDWGTSHD